MSHHEHHRQVLPTLLSVGQIVLVVVAIVMIVRMDAESDRRFRAVERQAKSQSDGVIAADAALSARIDAAERHVAELAKMSHERRAALADELRKESAKAVAAIESSLAQEKVSRGSQVNAERVERRNAIASLEDAAASNAQMVLREMQLREEAARSVAGRLAAAEGRLKALESRPSPRLYTDGCRYWLAP